MRPDLSPRASLARPCDKVGHTRRSSGSAEPQRSGFTSPNDTPAAEKVVPGRLLTDGSAWPTSRSPAVALRPASVRGRPRLFGVRPAVSRLMSTMMSWATDWTTTRCDVDSVLSTLPSRRARAGMRGHLHQSRARLQLTNGPADDMEPAVLPIRHIPAVDRRRRRGRRLGGCRHQVRHPIRERAFRRREGIYRC